MKESMNKNTSLTAIQATAPTTVNKHLSGSSAKRTIWLINASAYRPLSAFKTQEIAGIFKHDVSFAVCLFPDANGALHVTVVKIKV